MIINTKKNTKTQNIQENKNAKEKKKIIRILNNIIQVIWKED